MNRLVLVFIFLFIGFTSFSLDGNLLLIGGGAEKNYENSWSSQAYKWAVAQSVNKRVAIISFTESTDWLPDYFINSCGAVEAQNFTINTSEAADADEIYNNLITFDVIFLKGGDQYNYYATYKNTKTQLAIEYVYSSGGVICGTSAGLAILSGVIFTAENGSVYPNEAIENPLNADMRLANDMFGFFPGFIFDSHFTIRARFARLVGFMANWKFTNSEVIKGIGVDEMTALVIDKNGLATAYGIGSVNIYSAQSANTFSQQGNLLLADSVNITQLLQGCTYDFNTGEISGFSSQTNPEITEENGNYVIFASGTDNINLNGEMLSDFTNSVGFVSDKILILTSNNTSNAVKFSDKLKDLGATDIEIISIGSTNGDDADLKSKILLAKKYLFVGNEYSNLMNFMNGGQAGTALNSKIRSNDAIVCFVGDNSRFAGKKVVVNYLEQDAAYDGVLELENGLVLLKTSVIIPNTFFSSNYYENIATAIPFTLVTQKLTYGVWLNSKNYFKYTPTQENETQITAYGTSPVMILKNEGTASGISQQTAYGDGLDEYPQFSGFKNMRLSLIGETTPFTTGNSVHITAVEDKAKSGLRIIKTHGEYQVFGANKDYKLNIINLSGTKLYSSVFYKETRITNTSQFSGIYILEIKDLKGIETQTQKIIF